MRKRISLVCLFVVLLMFLLGCEPVGLGPIVREPGSIKGMVIDGITGEPMEGISVHYMIPLRDLDNKSFLVISGSQTRPLAIDKDLYQQYFEEFIDDMTVITSTDANGSFQLDDVIPRYRLTIWFSNVAYKDKSIGLIVEPNEIIDFGVVTMYKQEYTVDLSISVTDENNEIVENVGVFLTKTGELLPNIPIAETAQSSDDIGEQGTKIRKLIFTNTIEAWTYRSDITFRGIEPGIYRIRAEKNGYKTEIVEGVVVDKDVEMRVTLRE